MEFIELLETFVFLRTFYIKKDVYPFLHKLSKTKNNNKYVGISVYDFVKNEIFMKILTRNWANNNLGGWQLIWNINKIPFLL